jgi:hypothetical protein
VHQLREILIDPEISYEDACSWIKLIYTGMNNLRLRYILDLLEGTMFERPKNWNFLCKKHNEKILSIGFSVCS